MEEDILEEIEPLILYDTQEEEGEVEKTNEVDPLAVDPSEIELLDPVGLRANIELPAFDGKVICTPVKPLEVVEVLEVAVDVMKDDLEMQETSKSEVRNRSRQQWISVKHSKELQDCKKRSSYASVVSERPIKMHECPTCGRKVKDKSNFNKHLRTHKGIQHFSCEICHWKFCQPVDLRMHMRTHTDGKPFKCDVCGVAFARSWNLKSHRHVHFRTRQKCDLCGASFNLLSSLKIHLRKAHNGLSLFPCQMCGKLFPRLSDLSVNLNSRDLTCCSSCSGSSSNSSKPTASRDVQDCKNFFVCVDCGNIFEEMSALHEHRVKIHKAADTEQLIPLPHLEADEKPVLDSM